mgnify:CR=1 FL=1
MNMEFGRRGREPLPPRNVFGGMLEDCSHKPMTGFFRDGCCNTNEQDAGSHTVCAVMTDGLALRRVYVNDGGDIAIHLAEGETFSVGLVPVPERPALLGKAVIRAEDPVRGIATSGRHGRSFSLGIADAVTVLATSAARADAAAVALSSSQECTAQMREIYAQRKAQVSKALAGVPKVKVLEPEGGFFSMADVREMNIPSDEVRIRLLNDHGVCVAHGAAYGKMGEGTLRVSFASGGEALAKGLTRLSEGLAKIGV